MVHGCLKNTVDSELDASDILYFDSERLNDVAVRQMHNLVVFAASGNLEALLDCFLIVKCVSDRGIRPFFEDRIAIVNQIQGYC